MSNNPQNPSLKSSPQFAGSVWYQLHSEREAICEALLRQARHAEQRGAVLGETRAADQQMQARLRLIDDALDRLMASCTSRAASHIVTDCGISRND